MQNYLLDSDCRSDRAPVPILTSGRFDGFVLDDPPRPDRRAVSGAVGPGVHVLVRQAEALSRALGGCAPAPAVDLTKLGMRAGIHSGERERHGQGLRGAAVHLAARVMEVCEAGETIVSSAVKPCA